MHTHTQTQKQIHRCIIINEYIIINLKVIAIKYEYLFPVGTEIKTLFNISRCNLFQFFSKTISSFKIENDLTLSHNLGRCLQFIAHFPKAFESLQTTFNFQERFLDVKCHFMNNFSISLLGKLLLIWQALKAIFKKTFKGLVISFF